MTSRFILRMLCGTLGALGIVAVLPPSSTSQAHAQYSEVTWRKEVAPIVYANCTACHHTGGSGPFDLTTYAAAHRWGPQIADVVSTRYMPPWLPDPAKSAHFEGDRHLKPSDIELLVAWVKSGMAEGTGLPPKPPVYSRDWQMGPPDLILEMPTAVTEPASGSDIFVNFVLPGTVKQTRWVRAMEIQPNGTIGAGSLVHHANLVLDRTGSFRAAHPRDWQKGVPGMDLEIDSGDTFDPDSHLLFWKPDSTALVEPPGMPWRLDPGNDLVLNMHLKPTGKPEAIRARIGLYFTPTPATQHPMLIQLEHDAALNIPANDANFVVTDQLTLPVAVDVLALYPHAHYLCREMQGWVTLPGGQTEPLITIPQWDIDRQSVYRLATPLALPAGAVLHMRYVYDNSSANIHNPSSPPVRVHGGNRATDEMSHLWLQVLPHPNPGDSSNSQDPRLFLEKAWMEDALGKSPGDTIALYNLAALDQSAGNSQGAISRFRQLLAVEPRNVRALTALGSALETSGDSASASRQYKAALAIDPDSTDATFDLAQLDLRVGDTLAAEPLLRHLLARSPDDPDAHRLLAMAYTADGDVPKTLEELKTWARLTPEQPDAQRALAQVLSAAGQPTEALLHQRRVLELSPNTPDDWNDLGVMEARAGHSDQARAAFNHALQLDPGNAAAGNNLKKLP